MKKIILLAIALSSACGPSIQVFTDYDRDINMQHYKTFAWLTVKDIEIRNNPLYYNELTDKRIKVAADNQLMKNGYEKSDQVPDFILHYHIVVENVSQVRTEPYGYHYGPYWARTGMETYEYREGTLIIDLMDAKTNTLAWRGSAVTTLGETNGFERGEKFINDVVRKIFDEFPFRVNK